MTDNLTIAFDGDVQLHEFAEAMQRFYALVTALSDEVGDGGQISWYIEDLEAGSASATIRGESSQPEAVHRVVQAYGVVGGALQNQKEIPYSHRVREHAQAITRILDDRITSVRFQTPDVEVVVYSPSIFDRMVVPKIKYSFGTLKGKVQTLTSRHGLKFTLYDSLFDHAVTCYLQESQSELMRNAWGRNILVSGKVGRDPVTGQAFVVREIRDIHFIDPVEPGNYKHARGILPPSSNTERPEDIIRRQRDAQ